MKREKKRLLVKLEVYLKRLRKEVSGNDLGPNNTTAFAANSREVCFGL